MSNLALLCTHILQRRKNAPNKDKIVIDGQEYGLHTADTVSEMDSSHYSTVRKIVKKSCHNLTPFPG